MILVVSSAVKAQDITQPHPGDENTPVSGTLPVLYINTDDNIPITQKETYLPGTYWFDNKALDGIKSVGSKDEPLPLEIRQRGNSSRQYPKKPYKIKLGKKTEIYGMPKQKHFALLSHWSPNMGLIEMTGFELGRCVDLEWTPMEKPVEVVLNGYNVGLYYIAESVKIDSKRIDIYEQEDQNTDEALVDGGWLIEIDNYPDPCQVKIVQDPEGEHFETRFTYKTPEDLSDLQHDWLVDELTTISNMIYSADKSDCTWFEKIDSDQLARYYIVQELLGNQDAFVGSTYLHKDLGGKWKFGPLWDLGWSFSTGQRDKTFAEMRHESNPEFRFTWIDEMWKFPAFRDKVYEVWNSIYPAELQGIDEFITETANTISSAFELNYNTLWPQDHYSSSYIANGLKNKFQLYASWLNNYLAMNSKVDIQCDHKASSISVIGNADGSFIIQGPEVTSLKLVDVNGRNIDVELTASNSFVIDAPAGIYILAASTADGPCLPIKFVVR
ncbi:MAG: CotH kinase family protein [Muribaculaceae bacterium]|nr:CotH kinase family protein [Muribaculaceae bacterium]